MKKLVLSIVLVAEAAVIAEYAGAPPAESVTQLKLVPFDFNTSPAPQVGGADFANVCTVLNAVVVAY